MDEQIQPGVRSDEPLPPNPETHPYYVVVPIQINIINLTPQNLAQWVADHPPVDDGQGNAVLTILPLLDSPVAPGLMESQEELPSVAGKPEAPIASARMLYATAPVTFAFAGIPAAELKIIVEGRVLDVNRK